MAGQVKLPLVGTVGKKPLVFILGGTAGLLAFLWYRHRQAGSAAATDTSATADTTGTDTSGIDPATGLPYSQEYGGADGIDPATGIPYSQELAGGFYDPNSGQYVYPGGGGTTVPPPAPTATITTNAEWAQEVEAAFPTHAMSAAIGKYLTGQPVTSAQHGLIDQGIATFGYPPVRGTDGYPPAVKVQPSGHEPKPRTIIADGKQDLYQIAKKYHITEAQLVSMNLNLAHYVGTKKPIPKGTKVHV